jgi:hypothetical protein
VAWLHDCDLAVLGTQRKRGEPGEGSAPFRVSTAQAARYFSLKRGSHQIPAAQDERGGVAEVHVCHLAEATKNRKAEFSSPRWWDSK